MQISLQSVEDIRFRIRLLAIMIGIASLVALVSATFFFSGSQSTSTLWIIVIASLTLSGSIVLYILTHTNYAQIGVYVVFSLLLLCLTLADPLSGSLSGATWILFQLIPPLGVLILRKSHVTLIMAIISALALVTVGILQINGVITVELLSDRNALSFNLATQILVLISLSTIIYLISRREQRTFGALAQARHETQIQLEQVKSLNAELEQAMRLMRERDDQIEEQQAIQSDLQQTILQLAAPIVPILPSVVVIPLVGFFNQARLKELEKSVTNGLERYRANVAIIDLTGMQSIDAEFANMLFMLAQAVRLLGIRCIFVGVTPESAQIMVSLGVDTSQMQVMPTLQEATLSLMSTRSLRLHTF